MSRAWLGVGLGVALVAGILLSAMVGQLPVTPTEVIGSILRAVGVQNGWAPSSSVTESALWVVRFPRIVMGLAVGAALAVAGAVMQAIFGNPLAEPGVVGVSSGAALGAAIGIVLGVSALGGWSIAIFAFAGGLLATLLVYFVSRANGRTEVVTLLLTGIAVNAFGGAGLALLLFLGDSASREQIIFWQLGSLNGSRWQETAVVIVVAVLGTIAALTIGRRLDLLSLGERNALLVNRAGWITDLLQYSLFDPGHPPVAEGLAVRDALRESIQVEGVPFVVVDTAGSTDGVRHRGRRQ